MYPDAYIQYLVHFHGERDYFECHEILEEYWKETKEGKQSIWVGLILLAVSNYHFRRGNKDGASRTLKKAIGIFQNQREQYQLGMNLAILVNASKKQLTAIGEGKTYESLNLPITDRGLLEECQKRCHEKGYKWGEESNLDNFDLIHRHSTRDRSEVLIDRQNAISIRHENGRE